MSTPPVDVHYAPVGNVPVCGATPGRIAGEPWDATCKACRYVMIRRGECPACGQERLSWDTHTEKTTGVADGRLTARDIVTIFYLACDYCSETLIARVDADEVAAALTLSRWVPREPHPAASTVQS